MLHSRIVYVTTDLHFLDPAKAGGAVVQKSHLNILTNLGFEIDVLLIDPAKFSSALPQIQRNTQQFSFNNKTINVDTASLKISDNKSLSSFDRFKKILFDPTQYYYSFVNKENSAVIENYLHSKEIDFIWAQWFYSGLIAANLKTNIPVMYVHHDWQYKLVAHKKEMNLKNKILRFSKKRVEEKFVKNVNGIVSVSNTDLDFFNKIKIDNTYIPTTYNAKDIVYQVPKEKASIVHLGSLNTTANRVGLKYFLSNSWETIKNEIPDIQLEIIGEMPNNDEQLIQQLKEDKNIIVHGFVSNLDDVLYPYDIHIIPWNEDTGTRTRVPVIFQYKQCMIAMKKGVANMPEVTNDVAVLCNDWDKFEKSIISYYRDVAKRKSLSDKGYHTFTDNFTHQSQQQKIQEFIEKVCSE